MRSRRRMGVWLAIVALLCGVGAGAQESGIDSGRLLTTQLQWQRSGDSSVKSKQARGLLAMLYLDGTYAEVAAVLTKEPREAAIRVNLNKGYSARLGTWVRADEGLIRLESREVYPDEIAQHRMCSTGQGCEPAPETWKLGPSVAHTCRVEGGTANRVASALYCKGLVLILPEWPIDLGSLPEIVRGLAAAEMVSPTKAISQ